VIEIRRAETSADIAQVKALWTEYWEMLGLPLSFQNFGEQLEGLPGEFAPPKGLLLLAYDEGFPAGTVAVRPIDEGSCEAKRLYVVPGFRGQGLGRKLLKTAIEMANKSGYTAMFGDTLPTMTEAAALYESLGFERIGPYSADPTPDAIYLRLALTNGKA